MEARKLVNFPGGLELHIGVRRADTALFVELPLQTRVARGSPSAYCLPQDCLCSVACG